MDEPSAAGLVKRLADRIGALYVPMPTPEEAAVARAEMLAWWKTQEEIRRDVLTCGWTPVDSVGFYTDDDRKVIWCPACACYHAARVIPLPTSEVSPHA